MMQTTGRTGMSCVRILSCALSFRGVGLICVRRFILHLSIKYVILLQCLLYLFFTYISRVSLECKKMVSG